MRTVRRVLTSSLLLALAGIIATPESFAQMTERRQERRKREQNQQAAEQKEEPLFPLATRVEPKTRASEKGIKPLQAISKAYEEGNYADVLAKAVPFAESSTNEYEKAFAWQLAGVAAIELNDNAKAAQYLQAAIDANGLDNNSHYRVMNNLAAIQSQLEQWDASIKTLDRLLSETRTDDPKYLSMKAGLLSAAGRNAEAAKLFQELLAKNPNDKKVLMNAVATLQQADRFAEANALLLDAHKRGMLTEEREYRALYSGLMNEDGRWKQAAAIVDEGAAKGILPKDKDLATAYSIIANQAFFADDLDAAAKYYALGAPLASDGELWLNLAKVYNNQGKKAQQREAARQALAKGVKNTAEAKRLAEAK